MHRTPHRRRGRRRSGLLAGLGLACLFVASACTSTTPAPPHTGASSVSATRTPAAGSVPNIVFVLTDDLSMNLVSHMPHVLAMEHDGVTMSNYYVVDSLCCPSRAAIFTGQYPHDDGVITNIGAHGGYPAYERHGDQKLAFPVFLTKAGYRTGFFGKYLNGYSPTFAEAPGWSSWAATAYGYQEFDYTFNQDGTPHKYGDKPKDYLTDVISRMGQHVISSAASAHKPFMIELSTFAPHMPYVPAPRYAHSDPDVRYPRTPGYDRVPTHPPTWLRGRAPLTLAQQQSIDVDYRQRVRSVHAVDDMIGALEKTLRTEGVADNTYVVFSSDNGYHMGENRLTPGKQTAFDTDVHVPLVITGPGVPAGRTVPQLASNVDLAPTFEQLAGAQTPAAVDGVSLAGLWHGARPNTWQRAILVEHRGPNTGASDPDKASYLSGNPPSYEALRTAGALYVRYVDGEQEYYDTVHDPYELHNIAGAGVPPALPRALTAMSTCHGARSCQAAAQLP